MNKKAFIGSILSLTMVLCVQAEPSSDPFPDVTAFKKSLASVEQKREQNRQASRALTTNWLKSTVALSKAISSLDNFDCNVVKFEIKYLQQDMQDNTDDINTLVQATGCSSSNDTKCLAKLEKIAQFIDKKKGLIKQQNKLLSALNDKQQTCSTLEAEND